MADQRLRRRLRVGVIGSGAAGHDNAALFFLGPPLNARMLDDILAEAGGAAAAAEIRLTVVARRAGSSRRVLTVQLGLGRFLLRHIRAVRLGDGRNFGVINQGAQTGLFPFRVGKDNYPTLNFGSVQRYAAGVFQGRLRLGRGPGRNGGVSGRRFRSRRRRPRRRGLSRRQRRGAGEPRRAGTGQEQEQDSQGQGDSQELGKHSAPCFSVY